jgi:hypothetical protein
MAPGNDWEDLDVAIFEGSYPVMLGHINPDDIPGINRTYMGEKSEQTRPGNI